VRDALAATSDNKERVAATMQAFYTYVANDKAAFRLVFESDLTSEPAVRERVDRVTSANAAAIATVIRDDTGLPEAQSELLAVSLVGMAQVSARYLISSDHPVAADEAVGLVSTLAWRGISGYPRHDAEPGPDADLDPAPGPDADPDTGAGAGADAGPGSGAAVGSG
jgi:hypothetical protein